MRPVSRSETIYVEVKSHTFTEKTFDIAYHIQIHMYLHVFFPRGATEANDNRPSRISIHLRSYKKDLMDRKAQRSLKNNEKRKMFPHLETPTSNYNIIIIKCLFN